MYSGKPIQLLKDTVTAPVDNTTGNAEYHSVWEEVKRQATDNATAPNSPISPIDGASVAPIVSISGLLTETTVRMLTSASGESTLTSPIKPSESLLPSPLVRSLSPTRKGTDGGFSGFTTTNSTALTSPIEWDEFMGSGFGSVGGSLTFSDFGPLPSKQTSATVGATAVSPTTKSRSTRRRSVDFRQPVATTNGHSTKTESEAATEFPAKDASAIQSEATEGTLALDEALIDGWAEILLDRTVASAWPSFALYELRNPLTAPTSAGDADATPARIQWLAIETYVNVPPTEPSVPSSPTSRTAGKPRRSSSQRSEKRSRFGFFSSTTSLVKEGKEEKKEKRRDHVRRASEISVDSTGTKPKGATDRFIHKSAPDCVQNLLNPKLTSLRLTQLLKSRSRLRRYLR